MRKPGCSVSLVREAILKFVKRASLLSAAGSELSFRLPFAASASCESSLRFKPALLLDALSASAALSP